MTLLRLGDPRSNPPNKYPIYTRSGWEIPQEYPVPVHPTNMRLNTSELIKWHPNLVIRSESTYPYNCVGMIFAARRAWIEIDYVYNILKEDGYLPISRSELRAGDVVIYHAANGEPTHIALVIEISPVAIGNELLNTRVISKWGRDAEFIHLIEDVPQMLGRPSEYYTDRVGEAT